MCMCCACDCVVYGNVASSALYYLHVERRNHHYQCSVISNENLHLVLAVLQLSEYFCRYSTKSVYGIMSRLFVLVWAYNVL